MSYTKRRPLSGRVLEHMKAVSDERKRADRITWYLLSKYAGRAFGVRTDDDLDEKEDDINGEKEGNAGGAREGHGCLRQELRLTSRSR